MKRIVRLAREQGIALDSSLLLKYPEGTWFWGALYHDESAAEQLAGPLAEQVERILTQKPPAERQIRLAALRPVKNQAAVARAKKVYYKASDAARMAYNKAKALTPPPYTGITDPAWKACKEVNTAQKAFNKACVAQWAIEYPNHPIWRDEGLEFPFAYATKLNFNDEQTEAWKRCTGIVIDDNAIFNALYEVIVETTASGVSINFDGPGKLVSILHIKRREPTQSLPTKNMKQNPEQL